MDWIAKARGNSDVSECVISANKNLKSKVAWLLLNPDVFIINGLRAEALYGVRLWI